MWDEKKSPHFAKNNWMKRINDLKVTTNLFATELAGPEWLDAEMDPHVLAEITRIGETLDALGAFIRLCLPHLHLQRTHVGLRLKLKLENSIIINWINAFSIQQLFIAPLESPILLHHDRRPFVPPIILCSIFSFFTSPLLLIVKSSKPGDSRSLHFCTNTRQCEWMAAVFAVTLSSHNDRQKDGEINEKK